jgi:hypothetical protein
MILEVILGVILSYLFYTRIIRVYWGIAYYKM